MSKQPLTNSLTNDHFQVYVNSFLALLNARNYRQPERSDNIDVPQFRAHGSLVHIKGSAEDSQDSRKNVYQHPYDHDDDPYMSPRPTHAVTVSGASLLIEED